MKRRKFLLEKEEKVFSNKYLNITNIGNQIIFEMQQHTTTDLAEIVAIMMKNNINDEEFWKLPTSQFDKNIQPDKSIYWLSGGDSEWILLDNYSDTWYNCCNDFCNKWQNLVINSVQNSTTLGDIRKNFTEKLNLLTIYDWAISKGFVR